ncbi:S-layer homology domain-containing protein [Peptoniphilus grossensis]|uniref:S-layer homology domain-containing protein n=3 Tax=Peptoniphilus grossensis TaxID=1465756 RepID=A0ABU7XBC0_9FIRM
MNKIKRIISATLVGIMITPSIVSAYPVPQMEEINPVNQNVQLRTPANNVEDGIYTAPVEVAHAYTPGQKSMANNAIEHTAKVVYRGDKVTIELTFNGMNLMGMKGHLTNLFFYRDNKNPKNNNDVIEAEVIKTQLDLGLDGEKHNYPRIFSYTMDKSVFEASDFLWIKVWVDAMDAIGSGPGNPIKPGAGEQNAKIVIDKTKFTKVILNTQDLSNEIAAAKAIEQGKKTEEAFNTLKAAIASAEKVLEEATEQTQLDEAVKTLKAAVKAFNESADKVVPTPLEKEALTKEIAEAKKVEQGKKTDEAFNTLKDAITTAEKVLEEATEQTQLDEAVKTLKAAVKAFNESADKAVPTPLEKEALTKEIAAAKAIEQGKKTEEAFSKLKAAITSAEEVLNSATDQEALNQGVVALKAAVEEFNNSPDKEASSELVKYVKLNVEDGGPTDPKIRNILDDYAEIVKINEKTYLRLTYFSLEKRSNGLDYGTKQLKYSYDESGEKIEAIGKVIESGQNAGEYELSQIDIPIDGKPEVYLFGEFMASTYNNNKIPGKAIVRFSDSDIQGKTLGNIDKYIVSQKGFTQKEGTEKLEFDVEKDGKIYTPYTSLEKGKFKIINHGSGEIAIKIKRNSFLLGDLRHIKYTLDGTEPTADSKDAGLRNENKPAIGFDKYFAIYLSYEDVSHLKDSGGDIKVRFKGFDKDFAQSTESKEITVSFSKEAYDELDAVKDETNNISFKADSSREYCFNSTTVLKVENIKDSEILETFNKLAKDNGASDPMVYKLSFVDNAEIAKLDIDKSWNNEKFPLIKIKIEKEGADKNYYKNTAFYEVVNGKLVQLPYNYLIKKASIKNPDSTYIIGQKNYDTQLKEAKEALQNKMNQIETTINGNSLAEINLKNLLEKAKNLQRITLDNVLALNYEIDRNFEALKNTSNTDSEINKGLAKELVKCINSDIYKEIFTKDFYNQVVEIKNELEKKLQSGADLKDDLLKLDNLFKDPKYALPYKVTSVEIKRQDRDDPSMAGGCFMEEGKILYGKDENYLLLNLKTMSPGFLNAHLLELSVFKDRIDEDKLDVMSIYKYSDVMSGSSKLGIFDKQILVKLPKIEKDTYFIRVANDGMQGAAPGARLKFTAKGELIEDEPQAPLEKEALTKEIAEAKKVEQGKKTDEAFNTLKAAITTAEEVLNSATEQTQLDEAVKTLKAAVKAFNENADKVVPAPLEKEALTKEIAEAKKVEQGKKTDEAFNTLKSAITTAEEVLNSATEQTQLDEAVKTLKAAVKAFNESADKVVPTPLEKEALTKEIAEAKKVEQGKKTDEAFSKLQAAIATAEKVLGEATGQTQLDEAVKTLKAAVKAFNESADKVVPGPTPQPEPKPQPKPSYPSYPIYPWYNHSNKVSTSKTNKNTEIKKEEVKNENLNQGKFTDINGHWANKAINYVVNKGYFAGVSKTEFAPDKPITRGEFVTVLGRMLKIDTSKYSSQRFNDVNSSTYYSPYVTWANEVGIVSGVGEGNFAPDKALTREEMAVIMSKFLKLSNKKPTVKLSTNFKDQGSISPWAKEAVTEMAKLGVVKGMGEGNFSPKTEFTRAQVAQVLYSIENN